MITYLINFVLCSGLLLLVYRVFLMGENLYKFNRFYLLFSLMFSLAVPFTAVKVPAKIMSYQNSLIAKTTPQQAFVPVQQQILPPPIANETYTPVSPQIAAPVIPAEIVKPIPQQIAPAPTYNYLPVALTALYLLAAAVLLIRFIRNSYRISRSVSQNTVVNYHDTKLVLIDEDVTPHSFLKYVFINKKDYSEGTIEPEIICHEQTHVKQLHSLDIIMVELFQIIAWFNPFIHFYRKAIQLNHEFLADEAVIKNYHNTSAYQHLLLNKASQLCSLSLASPFNYQITKKRLIMMTKTTPTATAWFARLAIIPVITIAFLLFCNKTAAEFTPVKNTRPIKSPATVKNNHTLKKAVRFLLPIFRNDYPSTKKGALPQLLKEYAVIVARYADDRKYPVNSKLGPALSPADRARLEGIFKQMSKKQQEKQKIGFMIFGGRQKVIPTQAQLDSVNDDKLYHIWIDFKRVDVSELKKHQAQDFAYFFKGELKGPGYKNLHHKYDVSIMTVDGFNADNKRVEMTRTRYQYMDADGWIVNRKYY